MQPIVSGVTGITCLLFKHLVFESQPKKLEFRSLLFRYDQIFVVWFFHMQDWKTVLSCLNGQNLDGIKCSLKSDTLSVLIALWAVCRHIVSLLSRHIEFESQLVDLSRSYPPLSLPFHFLSLLSTPFKIKAKNKYFEKIMSCRSFCSGLNWINSVHLICIEPAWEIYFHNFCSSLQVVLHLS